MFKLAVTVALSAAALLACPTLVSADVIPSGKYNLDGSDVGSKLPPYNLPQSGASPAHLDMCAIIEQIISQSGGDASDPLDPLNVWLYLLDNGVATPSDLQIYWPFMRACLYNHYGQIDKRNYGLTYPTRR